MGGRRNGNYRNGPSHQDYQQVWNHRPPFPPRPSRGGSWNNQMTFFQNARPPQPPSRFQYNSERSLGEGRTHRPHVWNSNENHSSANNDNYVNDTFWGTDNFSNQSEMNQGHFSGPNNTKRNGNQDHFFLRQNPHGYPSGSDSSNWPNFSNNRGPFKKFGHGRGNNHFNNESFNDTQAARHNYNENPSQKKNVLLPNPAFDGPLKGNNLQISQRGRGGFHLSRGFGRGGSNGTGPVHGSMSGKPLSHGDSSRSQYDYDHDGNEVDHWLKNSRGKESISERNQSPVFKDPLPGSEEARSIAMKKESDRLKQSLMQKKKTVNLNQILSLENEAKGEVQSCNKVKSFPKNLAELKLDENDMRAIGRANTFVAEGSQDESSDDDIVEVQRSPSPERPVIDLDISPTKIGHCNASTDSSDSEVEIPPKISQNLVDDGCKSRNLDNSYVTKKCEANSESTRSCNRVKETLISHDDEILTRTSPESSKHENDTPFIFSDKTPPLQGLNIQRRRTSSSASSGTSGTQNLESDTINTNFKLANACNTSKSTTTFSGSPNDLRKKRIINDLKKISQSKLKDLVNNPGSGRLGFAMRELVKEHRSVLSRETRDVAEKRIPAEYLNQKSTDLPPDDSVLSVDYNIDWSILPGELLYALGDLFQDLESETAITPLANSGIASENTVSCAEGEDYKNDKKLKRNISVGKYSENERTDFNSSTNSCQFVSDMSQTAENSDPGRIRVRHFAKQSPPKLREKEVKEVDFQQNNADDLLLPSQMLTKPRRSLVDSRPRDCSMNAETSSFINEQLQSSRPLQQTDHHRQSTTFAKVMEREEMKPETFISVNSSIQQSQPREEDRPRIRESDAFDEPGLRANQISQCEEDSGANFSASVHRREKRRFDPLSKKISPAHENLRRDTAKEAPKKAKKAGKIESNVTKDKSKQRKFVHLEERSWFEEAPPKKNSSNCSESHRIKRSENRVKSPPKVNDPLPEISATGEVGNVFQENVSILPLLMMTVTADSLPNTVCTMTPDEMQRRLAEIDKELQNLVQERYLISQALKIAQSNVDMRETIESVSSVDCVESSQPQVKVEKTDATSTKDVLSTQELKISSKRKLHDSASPEEQPNSSCKRKFDHSESTDAKHSKKKRAKRTKSTVGHDPPKNIPMKDCFVRLESISPHPIQNKLLNTEVIEIADDSDGSSSQNNVTHEKNVPNKFFSAKSIQSMENVTCVTPKSVSFKDLEGTILDIKVIKNDIYAASNNGVVYKVSVVSRKVEAIFGERNEAFITCLEFDNKSNLWAGNSEGTLSLYNRKEKGPHVTPISTHRISNGILCMVEQWNRLYIGTKSGSVIPFFLESNTTGEPLNLGGFPVLSIKTWKEGPRKVLIVASRNQPISIRDADSGLLLRTLGDSENTVYSMLLDESLVYCGTVSNTIPVYNYQTGEVVFRLLAGKGVVDMKMRLGLLFCACYDGKIYIFDVKAKKLLSCFPGPGKMLLCLMLGRKNIICSSKDAPLICYNYPPHVLLHMRSFKKSVPTKNN